MKTKNLKIFERNYELDRYLVNSMLEHIDDVLDNLGNPHTFFMPGPWHWGSRPYDESIKLLVVDMKMYLYSLAGRGRFGTTALRGIANQDYEWNSERNMPSGEDYYWRCTLKPEIQVTVRRKLTEIRVQLINILQFLD